MKKSKSSSPAFTIVELLIVIVVIGILAAITIVAYNGIQQRAKVASLSSDLTNSRRILMADQVTSGSYPATLAAANSGQGITASNGNTLSYTVNTTTTPQTFCLTATNGTTSYNISSTTPLSAGPCPVGWWPLNGNANDASGNGNNGTINGATPTTGVNGGVNGAMSFNGSSDYIATGPLSSNFPIGSSPRTISAWVYNRGSAMWGIVNQGQGNCTGVMFGLGNINNNVSFWGGCNDYISSAVVPLNQWVFIAVSYDGSGVKTWFNGTQQGGGTLSGINTPASRLFFGAETIDNGATFRVYFNGLMDDVRIYATALTPDQVQAIYKEGAR